jgi:sensor domain CHASE-containing protein
VLVVAMVVRGLGRAGGGGRAWAAQTTLVFGTRLDDRFQGVITGAFKWGDAIFAFVQVRWLRTHTPWPSP